jgi:hypothetical protein
VLEERCQRLDSALAVGRGIPVVPLVSALALYSVVPLLPPSMVCGADYLLRERAVCAETSAESRRPFTQQVYEGCRVPIDTPLPMEGTIPGHAGVAGSPVSGRLCNLLSNGSDRPKPTGSQTVSVVGCYGNSTDRLYLPPQRLFHLSW